MTNEFVWVDTNGEETVLNIEERVAFSDVVAIAEMVVAETYKGGKYRPYMTKVALYNSLLKVYADMEFADTESMMYAIDTTNLSDFVNMIDANQYAELMEYINKMLAFEEKKGGVDRLCEYFMVLAKSGALLNVAEEVSKVVDLNAAKEQEK